MLAIKFHRGASANIKRSPPLRRPRLSKLAATTDSAVELIDAIISAARETEHDTLLEYVPDALIDTLVNAKKTRQDPDPSDIFFSDILLLGGVALNRSEHLRLDPYALRSLIYQYPRSVLPLSTLVDNDHLLRRVQVETSLGEWMTLTFKLQLEDSIRAAYKGIHMSKRWVLRSITGEVATMTGQEGTTTTTTATTTAAKTTRAATPPPLLVDDATGTLLARAPTPLVGPETIIQSQLAALRKRDFASVFTFASPANAAATGPLDRFTNMLLSAEAFHPLMDCDHVVVEESFQTSATTHVEIVKTMHKQRGVHSFFWTVSLQQEGEFESTWMTDQVRPLGS